MRPNEFFFNDNIWLTDLSYLTFWNNDLEITDKDTSQKTLWNFEVHSLPADDIWSLGNLHVQCWPSSGPAYVLHQHLVLFQYKDGLSQVWWFPL